MRFKETFLTLAMLIALLLPVTTMGDELLLKNWDRLTGKTVRMENGKLIFRTSYAGDVTIDWNEVSSLKTDIPILFVLDEQNAIKGIAEPGDEGKLKIKSEKIEEGVSVGLASVTSINPKKVPSVKINARVNAGLDVRKGNTETENYHVDGEFVARTEKNRYSVGAEFNLQYDTNEKSADNRLAYLKYDHFLSDKLYFYTNGSFESDEFQDLNLRTTLGAGLGYQIFETDMMNLSMEAGPSYVNENYDEGEDNDYGAGRWAVNFDRYFFDKTFQLFHRHVGLVSLEDTSDIVVKTRTGIRFPFQKHLNLTAQYNWDWDDQPAEGAEKVDRQYLLTLGYQY
jgi:putative salt-induced outer membrane protein YdiY